MSEKLVKTSSKERELLSRTVESVKMGVDNIESIKRTLSMKYFLEKSTKSTASWLRAVIKLILLRTSLSQTFRGFPGLITIVVLSIGGYLTFLGRMTIGSLVAFMGATEYLYGPVTFISHMFSGMPVIAPHLRRFKEITNMERENLEDGQPLKDITNIRAMKVDLTLGKKIVLRDINILIKRGEVIGIIGPSGSGKTSFALQLIRFYEPSDGIITINGVDYKKYKLRDLRKLVYYLPGYDLLLKSTLYDNLTLGRNIKENELHKALKIASVNFVLGLYRIIDPEKLSEGQRQRIALARAIAAKPKILILDEALSGVDLITENKIMRALLSYLRNSIIIIISHRASILKYMNNIYVMVNGRIVDEGTHEELFRRCIFYRQTIKT